MKTKLFAVLLAAALLFTGCSGITQEQYDAVVAERDTAVSERDKAVSDQEKAKTRQEKALAEAETERDALEAQVAVLELEKEELQEQLDAMDDESSSSSSSGSSSGITLETDTVIQIVETALKSGFGDNNVKVEYDADKATVTASVWQDDVTLSVLTAYTWGADEKSAWKTLTDAMIFLCDTIQDAVKSAAGGDVSVTLHLLDADDQKTVLLTITDGKVTEDRFE
ncbi:MAG: hypothetical protein ACK5LX_03960 [Oscillospiraceae bacterium]